MKISTSFLSCRNVVKAVRHLSLTDADYIHMDYIDFSFTDGRELSFRKMKKIAKVTTKRLDIHLMTCDLKKAILNFSTFNCEYITFHLEATKDPLKYIDMIHSYSIKCGIAINPNTDIEAIKPYLDKIDLVLVMGVEPGFGGQEFNFSVIEKLNDLRHYLITNKLNVSISVDGGVNDTNIKEISKYADIVVAGSFVTKGEDYQEQINKLKI